jgi:hypothetical protein
VELALRSRVEFEGSIVPTRVLWESYCGYSHKSTAEHTVFRKVEIINNHTSTTFTEQLSSRFELPIITPKPFITDHSGFVPPIPYVVPIRLW